MISYQGLPITAKSPPERIKSWAQSEAKKNFDDERKVSMASDMVAEGHKFLQNQPIGFNLGDDPDKLEKKLRAHLKVTCEPQRYGFFFVPIVGWLFWQILGGVISWAVQRLLSYWFPKKQALKSYV